MDVTPQENHRSHFREGLLYSIRTYVKADMIRQPGVCHCCFEATRLCDDPHRHVTTVRPPADAYHTTGIQGLRGPNSLSILVVCDVGKIANC